MGMNLGLAVATRHCKSASEQKSSCNNEIQQLEHEASWIKIVFVGIYSVKSVFA